MRRLLVALAAMAAILAPALPAQARAGFWAVTELDPLPAEVRPDVSYTVGFWVLQHGTHPYEGPGGLEPIGLRLTGEDGTTLTFGGTRCRSPPITPRPSKCRPDGGGCRVCRACSRRTRSARSRCRAG